MARRSFCVVVMALGLAAALAAPGPSSANHGAGPLLLRGTVVTMDAAHSVIENGRVLVADGKIERVWSGSTPRGISLRGVITVDVGPNGLIFPGLINLHDHPAYDVLPKWLPPVSHIQADGRPNGIEPYANRYQWNTEGINLFEFDRLVENPQEVLRRLDRTGDQLKHAEARAALGGQTAIQGVRDDDVHNVDPLLVRNVEATNFGRDHVQSHVQNVAELTAGERSAIKTGMDDGTLDAWIVHLAEGVRDAQRRSGDTTSSRDELDFIQRFGLLRDATVVVHGTGLERSDFKAMRVAPPAGAGDGLGAKLVWSPLSNLQLYGTTAEVYDALAEGLTISLGTDWTPSGSNTLLDELKVADIVLRDPGLLGDSRSTVPALADDALLDRALVDMVTRNPALSLRWPEVGTIAEGNVADLLVLHRPENTPTNGMPASPYRSLIDATSRDVALVLVDGNPIAGDVPLMASLRHGDYDVVTSPAAGYSKAVDVTRFSLSTPGERLGQIRQRLTASLEALGGDQARGILPTTYSYLRERYTQGAFQDMSQAAFRDELAKDFPGPGGGVNLERIQLHPLLTEEDDFSFAVLTAHLSPGGLIEDPTPPYRIYAANLNHVQVGGNPFMSPAFFERWYAG